MGYERFGGFGGRGNRGEDDRASSAHHRAALEALFTRDKPRKAQPASKRDSARLVTARAPSSERGERVAEHERLVTRLVEAEGRVEVTRAANDLARAGLPFPDEQEVHLQLLEHSEEEHARDAIAALSRLIDGEPAKRRALMESRLRRIEECADEAATRTAASELRRKLARAARPL
jgi:hypothetical protein